LRLIARQNIKKYAILNFLKTTFLKKKLSIFGVSFIDANYEEDAFIKLIICECQNMTDGQIFSDCFFMTYIKLRYLFPPILGEELTSPNPR